MKQEINPDRKDMTAAYHYGQLKKKLDFLAVMVVIQFVFLFIIFAWGGLF